MMKLILLLLILFVYGCGDGIMDTQERATCSDTTPCIGGLCDDGVCVSLTCTASDNSCSDDQTLTQCNNEQTGFDEITCDFKCIDGGCVDTYLCKTNEQQCLSDSSYRTCGIDRLSWIDGECDADTYCIDGSCIAAICTPGEKLCADQYTARSCNSNGTGFITKNCKSNEVCLSDLGECHALSCTPGENSCSNGQTATCKADGSGWENTQSCETGKTCDPDKTCGELCCDTSVCTPGDKRCSSDNNRYFEVCNPLGTGWLNSVRCEANESCSNGSCLKMACSPGNRDCSENNEVINCNDDGLTYDVIEACGDGYACDQGRCLEKICDANQTGCDPDNTQYFRQCNETGTGFSQSIRCGVGTTCITESGQCETILCSENQKRCSADGTQIQICNANGTGFVEDEICLGDAQCINNRCVVVICAPGETQCSGTQVEVCNATGSGWEAPVNCPNSGDNSQICLEKRCQPVICTPAEKSCVSGADYVQFFQTCNETGTGWSRESCDSGQKCINNGSCQAVLCIPGQKQCVTGQERVETCNSDGTAFVAEESCSGDQFCQLGSCVEQVCEPDQLICANGSSIQRCDSRGSRLSDPILCGDGLICGDQGSGDQCYPRPCSAGDSICSGDQIQYCNSSETDWDTPVNCSGGGVCEGNSCQPVICTANQYSCFNDAMRQRCNSKGTAYQTPESCGSSEACISGSCEPKICDQGDIECQNTKNYHVCNSSGTAFEQSSDTNNRSCLGSQLCDSDKDRCLDVICTKDTFRCSSDGSNATSQQCNGTGTSWGSVANCTASQVCTEVSGCVTKVCEPYEELSCITEGGTTYNRCNINGTGYQSTEESCPSGYICKSQECIRKICNPGDIVCVPGADGDDSTARHTCNSDGTGYDAEIACGGVEGSDVCYAGSCRTRCEMAVMNSSYMGCEYYALELDQGDGTYTSGPGETATYAIIVSNPSEYRAIVTVKGPGTINETKTINPNSLGTFTFSDSQRNYISSTTTGSDYSYLITSTIPVIAYQFSPLGGSANFSNDASLLMPTTAYGTSYRMLGWPHWSSSSEYPQLMTIVAKEDDTDVIIEFTGYTQSGGGISQYIPGNSLNKTLDRGEVLQIATRDYNSLYSSRILDLSGSSITADKPIGVFSSHRCTQVPFGKVRCDHIEQQLFPTNTWGMSYLMVKTTSRNKLISSSNSIENEYYRVVAHEDNTNIIFSKTIRNMETGADILSASLDAGDILYLRTDKNFTIVATKSILVAQFISSVEDTVLTSSQTDVDNPNGGDPAFIMAVPTEQFRKDYLFLVPDTYTHNYATVIAPKNAIIQRIDYDKNGNETVDENGVPNGRYTYMVTGDPEFSPLDSDYYFARLNMGEEGGSHSIVSDQPIGISVYGFDAHVSYGYPAGLDLKSIK